MINVFLVDESFLKDIETDNATLYSKQHVIIIV